MGHTHLATVTGPLHLTNAEERLKGFRQAVKEAKLQFAPEHVQEATLTNKAARQ
jgi:DNA-binding LacI/PurR family transcriptional regulator